MSSRETEGCAFKYLISHEKICTSMRRYHGQETAVEISFKVKRRAGAKKFTFRFVSEPSQGLCAYLYPRTVQLIERINFWSWGPNKNFQGQWICVSSSSLVLISNTLLFNVFSTMEFKGLYKNRGEIYIINFILQNRIWGRKVACACSLSSVGVQVDLHPCCSTQKGRVLLKSLSFNRVSYHQLIMYIIWFVLKNSNVHWAQNILV